MLVSITIMSVLGFSLLGILLLSIAFLTGHHFGWVRGWEDYKKLDKRDWTGNR